MALELPASFRRFVQPALIAAPLVLLYLIVAPLSADHAAQEFRTGLFELEGPGTWNNLWFGGHHTPGYSVIFPPLASLIGAREVGALAAIVAALLFAAITERHWGKAARIGAAWFAVGTSINLYTGRLTFALGVAIALGAVFAMQRGYRRTGLCLAVLCPMASPVAALFLACGAAAYWIAERSRVGLELAAVAFGAAVSLAFAFPEGGSEPFDGTALMPALMGVVAMLVFLPRSEKVLRTGVTIYGVALIAAFLVDNPMGGNATRMGSLLVGPLLACALWPRGSYHRILLLLLLPAVVYYQWTPVLRDLEEVRAEPSVNASYYAPISGFLGPKTAGEPARVEVVPTANHWEAAIIPPAEIPLARGWERQLDRKLNPLFYDDTLTPTEYHLWLDHLAVRYVALSNGELDYAGRDEAELIRGGLTFLKPVFTSPDWTVYEVRDPIPIAEPPGQLVELRPGGFTLDVPKPGSYLVRVRYSGYYSLAHGVGCVEESPSGFTTVQAARRGRTDVVSSFSPARIFQRGPSCRSGR